MQTCYKIHDGKQHAKRTKSCHDWHTIMNVSPRNANLCHIKEKLVFASLFSFFFQIEHCFPFFKTVAATISHIVPRVVEYDLSQDTLEP